MKESRALYSRGCWSYLFWMAWMGITAAGWVRFAVSLKNGYWLNQAGVEPGPAYLVVSGGLWGLVGLAAMVWMWLHRPAYPMVGMTAALFFAITYWLDRLVFSRPDGTWVNLPFSLILTVVGLGSAFVMLYPGKIAGWWRRS